MTCNNQPNQTGSDNNHALLLYANQSGTAAMVLSASAKALPPAGAAFVQGMGLGIAANFRIPASVAAGLSSAINNQPNNAIIGGMTFNREALAITGGLVQTLGLIAAISGAALGPLGWGQ